jgi:hypothetical protein
MMNHYEVDAMHTSVDAAQQYAAELSKDGLNATIRLLHGPDDKGTVLHAFCIAHNDPTYVLQVLHNKYDAGMTLEDLESRLASVLAARSEQM